MSDILFNSPADHETITRVINKYFNNSPVITITQFRDFLGISKATDAKMRRLGQYPRIINLPGCGRDSRLLVADVISWLENGGCLPSVVSEDSKKRNKDVLLEAEK